jgi:hypothetical protein
MSSKKQYIYYSGIGANASGKHTIREFLDIMNANFDTACSLEYLDKKGYKKNCSKGTELIMKVVKEQRKNPNYKPTKKMSNKFISEFKKCEKFKKTRKNRRSCNVEEYINFSGAEKK